MTTDRERPHDMMTAAAARNVERVLVVEDEAIVARDIERMLEQAGYDVVVCANTYEAARRWAEQHTPDLALVDIALPEGRMAGLDLAGGLRQRGVRVVFVTAHADRETITRAGRLRPCGYLVKPFTETQLLAAVTFALAQPAGEAATAETLTQAVAGIESRLGQLTTMLVEAGVTPPPGEPRPSIERLEALRRLSAREREVLRLLLANRRVPQIATRLFISQHTVRTHLKSIFRKLDVHSQAELIDRLGQNV